MANRLMEYTGKTIILLAVLLVGIYHIEIKEMIATSATGKIAPASVSASDIPDPPKIKADILLFFGPVPPSLPATEPAGFHCGMKQYFGEASFAPLPQAIDQIQEGCLSDGVDGIANLTFTSITAEAQGSQWNHSVLLLCGDKFVFKRN